MTDILKAGDTVWVVDGEWIYNGDDGYYDIMIPTYVSTRTVDSYEERPVGGKILKAVTLENGWKLVNHGCKKDFYLTEDEALKALREERKQFLTDYLNDWQKIVEELQQLLKEQSND